MSNPPHSLYFFATFLQFFLGLFLAWKFWNRIGVKTGVAYYLVRTLVVFTFLPQHGDLVPPDIKVWLVHAGWMVDQNMFPAVDFPTAYHLGFNLILWASYSVVHSPFAIMFAFGLFEMAAIPLLYFALRDIFDEKTAKRTLILFVSSPCLWRNVLFGQDEPVLVFFFALLLLMLARNRTVLAAVAAFLGFAATKILTPVYFAVFFVCARLKGILLLAVALGAYWLLAIALGGNPFDLTCSDDLSRPADSLADSGFVRGCAWFYLRSVPGFVQYAVLATVMGLTTLLFLPTLVDEARERCERLRATCALTSVLMLEFLCFFRISYEPYIIPFLPVAFATLLTLDFKGGWSRALALSFFAWTVFFEYKEAPTRWVRALGYGLDVILYVGYVVYGALFLAAAKAKGWLSSPCKGIGAAFGLLGLGGEAGKCKAGGCE